MTREEQIISEAKKHYYDDINCHNALLRGVEWADKHPNSKTIAEYLYKEKGYPLSLNGEIPTFEETMKDVQIYNVYKTKQWIEKACDWLREQKEMIGISFQEDFIERFKIAMQVAYKNDSKLADRCSANVWHDASEVPRANEWILMQIDGGDYEAVSLNKHGVNIWLKSCRNIYKVSRWAYISDLLPKGGEK